MNNAFRTAQHAVRRATPAIIVELVAIGIQAAASRAADCGQKKSLHLFVQAPGGVGALRNLSGLAGVIALILLVAEHCEDRRSNWHCFLVLNVALAAWRCSDYAYCGSYDEFWREFVSYLAWPLNLMLIKLAHCPPFSRLHLETFAVMAAVFSLHAFVEWADNARQPSYCLYFNIEVGVLLSRLFLAPGTWGTATLHERMLCAIFIVSRGGKQVYNTLDDPSLEIKTLLWLSLFVELAVLAVMLLRMWERREHLPLRD
jgi:hypothetical protein